MVVSTVCQPPSGVRVVVFSRRSESWPSMQVGEDVFAGFLEDAVEFQVVVLAFGDGSGGLA